MKASIEVGIAFQIADPTVMKYKTAYGIDLEEASGKMHHLLPVPSLFIIGRDGLIQYSYINPNYKVRNSPDFVLEVASAAMKQFTEEDS